MMGYRQGIDKSRPQVSIDKEGCINILNIKVQEETAKSE